MLKQLGFKRTILAAVVLAVLLSIIVFIVIRVNAVPDDVIEQVAIDHIQEEYPNAEVPVAVVEKEGDAWDVSGMVYPEGSDGEIKHYSLTVYYNKVRETFNVMRFKINY